MHTDPFDVLSDDALLQRTIELTQRERRLTFNIVMHLAEIELRRIYLRRGYASMYDFCLRRLGYAESAAYIRIKTARCIRTFAVVGERLRRGDVTISTVATIAAVMTNHNVEHLLQAAAGKSQRDVKLLVAQYRTGKPLQDRIRPIVIERPSIPLALDRRSAPTESPSRGVTLEGNVGTNPIGSQGGNNPPLNSAAGTTGATRASSSWMSCPSANGEMDRKPTVTRETYYEFTIAADEEFMGMYRRVRTIHSIKAKPGEDIAATFKALMSDYIARNAPEEKMKRRAARGVSKDVVARPTLNQSRSIPENIKDEVRTRDGDQCTHVGEDGARCGATQFLQFDHRIPFARGGPSTKENVRLLCAAHNRLEAEGVFGRVGKTSTRSPADIDIKRDHPKNRSE